MKIIDWESLPGWDDPVIPETVDAHEVQDEDTQDLEEMQIDEGEGPDHE